MSLNNIFQKPVDVKGVGSIYPVKLKDWDEFEDNLNPIILGKNHIQFNTDEDIPLLDRLMIISEENEGIIHSLCRVFDIITRTVGFKLVVSEDNYAFINNENQLVTSNNYEKIRELVLYQNILFEPKIYKNPHVAKWAAKVLEARKKNAPNVTLEDKISTVSVMTGKHYWDLAEYTIYQIDYDFNRIIKIKDYDSQSMLLANPYADNSKLKIKHFAESIDMYENPYDTVFKDKNSLNKMNIAIQ